MNMTVYPVHVSASVCTRDDARRSARRDATREERRAEKDAEIIYALDSCGFDVEWARTAGEKRRVGLQRVG